MKAALSARIPANKAMVRLVETARHLDRSCTGGDAIESLLLIVYSMKIRLNCAQLAALPVTLAAAFSSSSFSQTSESFAANPQLAATVVSATRSPARVDDLVGDVVVIDRAMIEKSSGRTLAELLARVPGLQISSNGGLGQASSVRLRGAEARHTILLVDGVRYGSATLGLPNFDNLPLDMVDRIEVLQGSASALYGSDAVGGVVQVFMRKGAAAARSFSPYAALSLGSEQFNQSAGGFSGRQNSFDYALGLQRTGVTGISATNLKVPFGNFNPDRDGFRQNAFNGSVAYQINTDWRVDASVLQSDGTVRLDDGPNRDSLSAVRTTVASAGVQGQVSQRWKSQLRLSQSTDSSSAIVAAPFNLPGLFKTTQNQLTWQNDVATAVGVVVLGAESLSQKVDSSTAFSVNQRSVMSYFAGINGNAGKHAWQANARRDSNSQFGVNSTGFIGYGYSLSPAWRVNATHATSFVAPSFNQLYFPNFGNAALQPERGRNTDIGLSYSDAGHTVKLVTFNNRIRGFITNTTLAANVPQARINGTTLGYNGAFGALAVNASIDMLNPRNELTGKNLVRRSKSVQRLGADYALNAWTFGGAVLKSGESFDNAANTVKLDGYTTVDAYADYTINQDFKLQVKLNNLANKPYETSLGYNQPGRGLFVTLRWQPK